MMQLHISGNSPYARKARIAARETGLISEIEEITVGSFEQLQEAGPGAKIPVLVCEDGTQLCESLIITRYLNELAKGQLLPSEPSRLRHCLEIESVATVLLDSIFARSLENNQRNENERSMTILEREQNRTARCLDRLNELTTEFEKEVTLATIAVASSLGYASWRAPEDNWAQGRDNLNNYYEHSMKRRSFAETAPVFNQQQ